MTYEIINERDVPVLPAKIFGTDDIAVQMAVFLVIIGMVNFASLFLINIVGRSARHSFIMALEEVFLAAFGLFLTIMGVVVQLLVQEMSLAFRVLSINLLVSHAILGILYLIVKVKQMNQLTGRLRTTNETNREVNRMQLLHRLSVRNNDALDGNRVGNFPYRVVNPGSAIGNEITIPPNVTYTRNSFCPTTRLAPYREPFGTLAPSQSTVSTNTDEVDPLLRSNIADIRPPTPSTSQDSSSEPSSCASPKVHGKPFRLSPSTFQPSTADNAEPSTSGVSAAKKMKPTPSLRRTPSGNNEPEPIPSTSRQGNRDSEPIPSTSRQGTRDPEPIPSTSRQGTRDLEPLPSTSRQGKKDPYPLPSTSRQGNRDPAPLPSTSRQGNKDPEPLPSTSRLGNRDPAPLPSTSRQILPSKLESSPIPPLSHKTSEPAGREKAKEPTVSFNASADYVVMNIKP